jgi:ABC-2 type transport system ATP-binding protein
MKLIIDSLSKTYANGVHALKDVTLTLNNGMFGLLGPNGAGKSSLMRTIATLQEADKGAVFLDDLDVLRNKTRVRQLLGYLPQEFGVYPKVSAERVLNTQVNDMMQCRRCWRRSTFLRTGGSISALTPGG